MCKTCNGTGGTNIEHGKWGVSFHPCPDSECDFDRDKKQAEIFAALDRLVKEKWKPEKARGLY